VFLQAEFPSNPAIDTPDELLPVDRRADPVFCCGDIVAGHETKDYSKSHICQEETLTKRHISAGNNTLPEKLKHARKDLLKLTQAELAEKLGTSQSGIAKWEKGEHRPLPQQFVKIARLLAGKMEALYFYSEAGVPKSFFEDEAAPMPAILIDTTEGTGESLSDNFDTFRPLVTGGAEVTVQLLRNTQKLGDPQAVHAQDVLQNLTFPSNWFPKGATIQAVRFPHEISPFVTGEVIALVDTSRRDPDRLAGSIVVVRTPTATEPMTLRKDGATYFLVPLHEDATHQVRVLRHRGTWSIIGKVLKWIGDAPTGKR
jgi:transcriptional regulator with XRE-family HTH domain